jgi:DNA-directed RNA polymerase subunit L
MSTSTSIKLIELSKQKFEGLKASQLVLEFSGKGINSSIVNTLMRLSLDDVPTYGFIKDSINIEKNTSIFDNDYMKNRLEQFTIPNIKVPIEYLHLDYWLDVDYSDPERLKHSDDTKTVELVIHALNDTTGKTDTDEDILNVTTDWAKYYEDNVEIKNKFDKKYPALIIKLKPGQEFKCNMKGVLGCGRRNDIWAAAANSYFETDDDKTFKFTIESQGQLDEYKILYNSCIVVQEKLKEIKEKLERNVNVLSKDDKQLHIFLENETQTMGNIINEALQDSNNIKFSGLSQPDGLVDEILIKLESVKPNPLKYVFEIFEDLSAVFKDLQSKFKKMGKL